MNRIRSLLVAACLMAASAAHAQTTFKIATVVPEGTDWIKTMRAGTEEIEQRTDGRVTFKFYTGGVQGTETQVKRKMRIGQLHGGVFTSGGLRAFQKDAELFGLPMLFDDYDEVRYVRERMDGELIRRLEEAGFISFGFAGGGFAYLMSNTPIAHLDDMKGLKIWIPEGDEIARRASSTLGISPVSLPLTDVLTGLQTDLIDTVMGPPVGVLVMQWHTAVSHITDLRIAYAYAALLLDKRTWSRVSEADQVVVREVMERIYRGFDAQGIADDKAALQALYDDGLKKVALDDGQKAAWQARIDATNHEAAAQGVLDPVLLEQLTCHRSAYRDGSNADCAP